MATTHMNPQEGAGIMDLPTELRMEIFELVMTLNNVPHSYGYTATPDDNRSRPLRTHGMLLANRALSSEYSKAYYERTNFFLRIDPSNAFTAVPHLRRAEPLYGEHIDPPLPQLPPFWNAPTMIKNLRKATVYIEIGEIAVDPSSGHSSSMIARASRVHAAGYDGPTEVFAFRSHHEAIALDERFDNGFVAAIKQLLRAMEMLQHVSVVWDSTVTYDRRRNFRKANTKWTVELLCVPLVEAMKEKPLAKSIRIRLGDQFGDEGYGANCVNGVWQ
ncbi:hypothetical protein BS50DRAFT_680401 [Corynespora cassiicola Philippines]|uniref:Uncharacterized protein n=1 Tax=Corynespora cassiicola Philippines TaxID=1448308 RepID=A0A2T2NAQ1_CORCC|nr:hypothetical protein BS50DRAFT_680401 [Corynespora cassiicola Philippines]